MRVGDRDREQVATALRRHFVQGRLSTDELEERIGATVHARTRRDLAAAMAGLPLGWEDLPGGVQTAARRVRRGVGRVRFFFALARAWLKVNVGLAAACGVALVVGAPPGTTVGAAVAAWALACLVFWHVWRRGPQRRSL